MAAPGITINVGASGSNPRTNQPTGTWFALGLAHGPSGIAVPINSINDFNTYFGQLVNGQVTGRYNVGSIDSSLLYDALDVYFREGGITAYVSRVIGGASVKATSATGGKFQFTAAGGGIWANSSNASALGVIFKAVASTVNGQTVYSCTMAYNGNITATSPALYSDLDVVTWVNSLPLYQSLVTATYNAGGSSVLPSTGNSASVYMGSGTGATAGTYVASADADIDAALSALTDTIGPGQVSFPGSTTAATYSKLAIHAQALNRVAFLDGADGAGVSNASTLATAVQTLQTTASVDPSYAAMFAPWVICPGIVNNNPTASTGVVLNRTVPPSAFAAARCAFNDSANDSNVAAAGVGAGTASYIVGVSVPFNATDRSSLNNGGVNVVRVVPNIGQIVLYGFRSCAFDQNWVFLNNVRFRMQVNRDFAAIAEAFVFSEIDGKGQIFGMLAGQLSGKCQSYWLRNSIYGVNASDAFTVNTGPQVNTPATIAAGQMNAQVNLRMAPFAEFVTINVTKYSINAALPQYNA